MLRWLRQILSSPKRPPAPPPSPRPPPTDEDVAILHRFLALPDRPRRREAVVRRLEAQLQAMLGPMGYVRHGQTWALDLPNGRAVVQIKRFSGGLNATLEVGFQPAPGTTRVGARLDHVQTQLPNFVQTGEGGHFNPGLIYYAQVDHDPAVLDFPLAVLRDRALPWAVDHGQGNPDWKTYRDRPLRS